jgi:hypothetical protein
MVFSIAQHHVYCGSNAPFSEAALERLIDGSGDDLVGTACRVIRLNVTMSEPRYRDDDDEIDKTVDVTVPDDMGAPLKSRHRTSSQGRVLPWSGRVNQLTAPFYNSGTSVGLTSKEPCEILNSL